MAAAPHAVLWVVACSVCGATGGAWPDAGSAKADSETMQHFGDCCPDRRYIVLRYVRRQARATPDDALVAAAARRLVACNGDAVFAAYEALACAVKSDLDVEVASTTTKGAARG